MSYSIIAVPKFKKELKKLAKKHLSIINDLSILLDSLEINPKQGTNLGNNCYKIRLTIKSKAKGKSGGARVITNIVVDETTLYLLAIYDKSDKDSISDNELLNLLKTIEK